MNAPVDDYAGSEAESDSTELLARRAALLELKHRGTIDGSQSAELENLTSILTDAVVTGSNSLRRLTIEHDSALLGRLAALEPVHPFADATDRAEIRSRTEHGRRCYVLENSALAGHPLNVVWLAIRHGLPLRVDEILGPTTATDSSRADTCVFYSIWNVEKGLSGIPGGSSLLTEVMTHLRSEVPSIETYTTLSPIPGFRDWLTATDPELATRVDADPTRYSQLLEDCVRYLSTTDNRGMPIDDVARFHMRNGARLWRLVPRGDMSDRGWIRSFGVMVNYRYAPEDLEANRAGLASGRPAVGESLIGMTTTQ